ncbi:hypothetical protein F8E02_04065 [Methanoculleus sp. Wushi-C6]|uniref:Uncharacterized protein n=1 Tax=Methanoculleus caldifontis TaxID=2651577 RepID=A0ABU3WZG9_9EURY|nr:hypothetical protein [Methanoculleus sp. Wushi-C6]MDV2481197.1 hypothetical protein [Methanoculleus sp. Wushi-C6]
MKLVTITVTKLIPVKEAINAVAEVSRSDMLTLSLKLAKVGRWYADFCGFERLIATSNSTIPQYAGMLAAAIGPVPVRKLPDFNEQRVANIRNYKEHCAVPDVVTPYVAPRAWRIYHHCIVRMIEDRSFSRNVSTACLHEVGVGNTVHDPITLPERVHADDGIVSERYPVVPRHASNRAEPVMYPLLCGNDSSQVVTC